LKKLSTGVILTSILLGSSTLIGSTSAQASTEVSLAYQAPITGSSKDIAIQQELGVLTALELYNESKPKVKVNLVIGDDSTDPVTTSTNLAANTSIVGVVGPITSGSNFASFPAYKAAKMPLIATAATNPGLTDPTDSRNGIPFVHRMVLTDNFQGPALTEWAIDKVSSPNIYVVDDHTAYGVGLGAIVTKYIGLKNYTLAGDDSVPTTTDYTSTSSSIMAANANVVIFAGYYGDSANLLKSLRQNGYTGVYAASAGSAIPAFITQAGGGEIANGARMTLGELPFDVAANPSEMKAFLKVSQGESPTGMQYVSEAYNATNVYLTLIKKGFITRDSILNNMNRLTYTGIGGVAINFNAYGDVVNPPAFSRWTVSNGKLLYMGVKPKLDIKKVVKVKSKK